ncbi:hypothetical protein TKK_0008400 [Trichogramma kaykai]|uniref:PHD-type domain-containing protein n=1 Tax=Trichogramma kaykai TaxID=54128 RepID=A0ABD2X6A2_9HYME
MDMNGIGLGLGVGVGAPSPSTTQGPSNPKKKRRNNSNAQQANQRPQIQDFLPPPLSGFGDIVVASNPFDDAPPQGMNPALHNGPQQMHHHPQHHMGNPQIRGMNPMAMSHMGNMNAINNPPMGNPMGPMGSMPNSNHPNSMNNMNHMNSMRPNMPQGNIGPSMNVSINMNMNQMINPQINGPGMNSPINGMNHNIGSPMGGPIGSPINNMSPNHIPNNPMNVPAMNQPNVPISHSAPQSLPNHMNNIRPGLNRPHNMPHAPINSPVTNSMVGNNQMGNMNMMRPQMNNMSNVNLNQRNQLTSMGNPMGNISNNIAVGKPPSHGLNVGNTVSPHGLPGPGSLGPKPIPETTGKVYPPDQPMVFNHQNPNAPPISPCGVCHKEVHANDQAILCESGCNFWFHRRCTGLSEIAYDLLMHEVCAEWACDRCMQSKNVALVKLKP